MNTEQNQQYMQHLGFIQDVITRMNTNSFQIKEITILIITACLAIYASEKVSMMLLIPIFPTVVFWYLDSYYLLQERKFRAIYDDVANIKKPPINSVKLYSMPINKYNADKKPTLSLWNVFKSTTISVFYGSLISFLIICFTLSTAHYILIIN